MGAASITLAEDADTSSATVLTAITITDDGLGTNTLSVDTVNLGDGADVVIHRFGSFATEEYTNTDGGDVINNFEIGEDKLLLVDEAVTPLVDWAALIAADQTTHNVRFDVIKNATDEITGLKIVLGLEAEIDGVYTGDTLTINFTNPIANSATDITGDTVNEASELNFVTNTLFGGEDYIKVISDDDLSTDYGITIL